MRSAVERDQLSGKNCSRATSRPTNQTWRRQSRPEAFLAGRVARSRVHVILGELTVADPEAPAAPGGMTGVGLSVRHKAPYTLGDYIIKRRS